jgi:pimeloyl-ACP methyl ester carboxylesterase
MCRQDATSLAPSLRALYRLESSDIANPFCIPNARIQEIDVKLFLIGLPLVVLSQCLAGLSLIFVTGAAFATGQSITTKTVVLVHGAWADASSWNKVIPLLEARGLRVVAVQNPLSSLAEDVAATTRVINMQTGPVILVGHSWAGVVITQAGSNDKVAALVYVAAFAPDSGQSINDLIAGFPQPPYIATLRKDGGGYLYLAPEALAQYFAPDLPAATQKLLMATQGPWFYGCLADKVTKAAWHDKPTWWVLPEEDQIIDPRLQQGMAAAAKATVTKVQGGHLAMLSRPTEVAAAIVAAANSIE